MKNPNGYGSVFKMSGKRRKPYRVRKMTGRTEEGKAIYTNIGYAKTRAEGMQMLAEFNANPYDVLRKDMTFIEMCDMWIKSDKKDYSKHTIANRNTQYKMALPIHDIPIKSLKTAQLQTYMDSLTCSVNVKKMTKSFLNKVFTFAMQNDLIEKNYTTFIQIDTRDQPESTRKAFTKEDIIKLFKLDGDKYDIGKVLLFTGFRINELLDVEIKNVHLDEGYIVGGSKTKAGRDRVVPISKHIRGIIEKHYDENNTYLFETKKGRVVYSSYSRWWKTNVGKNVGDYVIHDTRHTFVTMFSETDADMLSVKRIVGHSTNDVTEAVYTHKSIESLIKTMAKLDEYVDTFME